MIVWALFDSGNGSYTKGVKKLDKDIEIYPIGIDIENKNHHFINLNLADYSRLFGDNTLFDTLDKLPKPDLIIASPPCESWSNASAMDRGNACWKQEQGDSLLMAEFGNTSRECWVSKSRLRIIQGTTIMMIIRFLNQLDFLEILN